MVVKRHRPTKIRYTQRAKARTRPKHQPVVNYINRILALHNQGAPVTAQQLSAWKYNRTHLVQCTGEAGTIERGKHLEDVTFFDRLFADLSQIDVEVMAEARERIARFLECHERDIRD